jgi:hypothetical protein
MSGVFERARVVPASLATADEIADAAHQVSGAPAAVLLAASFRQVARAALAGARVKTGGIPLEARLGAWLPRSGDRTRVLGVPLHVRASMREMYALVVPIAALDVFGWIAVPLSRAPRDVQREIEAIASAAALDLERGERACRLETIDAEFRSAAHFAR